MNTTRREFAQGLASLGAAAAGMLPPPPTKTDKAKPAQPSAAAALADVLRVRYPNQLSDQELAQVQTSLAGKLAAGQRLKQFKLQNGDEPAFIFTADIT